MKILITGCTGYLGARLFEVLSSRVDHQVFGTYLSAGPGGENESSNQFLLDITQDAQVSHLIESISPDCIIHCAAIVHGPLADNPKVLQEVNVEGTKNIVSVAQKTKSRILYMSTIAALDTKNYYGKSKFEGELVVKDSYLDYCILRPSVIIGLSPNRDPNVMFNSILYSILKNETVLLDSEWKFQASWVENVCEAVVAWVDQKFNDPGPIYPIVSELKSRFELAEDIMTHFNLHATPVRNPRYQALELIALESMRRNNLPIYDYSPVIANIVEQIKSLKTLT